MAWKRDGDTGATHPAVLKIEVDPEWDDRLVNEAYGFVQRCATQSAQHTTDGIIDQGTAILMGNRSRWEALVRVSVRCGLLTVHRRGKNPSWKIIDDPDFIHIRTKAELEWEKARKLDVANPRLIVEVKRRDGDGCRYCGVIVQWRARRGGRMGSYDHRPPGKPARGPEDLVVCCNTCNGRRGNRPLAEADKDLPLLPVPTSPFYSQHTVEYLASHGVAVTPAEPSEQPGSSSRAQRPSSAARPSASAGQQPGSSASPQRPSSAAPAASDGPVSADPAETGSTDRVGSGRDGAGRAGTGLEGEAAPPRPRRGRRGRGGSKPGRGGDS